MDRKILESARSKTSNEVSQVIGYAKLQELRVGDRRIRTGGGVDNGERGKLRGNDVRNGLNLLDLISLFERDGFELIGSLGGLESKFLGLLGGFGDEIGDFGGGRRQKDSSTIQR